MVLCDEHDEDTLDSLLGRLIYFIFSPNFSFSFKKFRRGEKCIENYNGSTYPNYIFNDRIISICIVSKGFMGSGRA